MKDAAFTTEIPATAVELLVLKTLELLGPMQAYGIARFISATSEDVLSVDTPTLYRALRQLAAQGLVTAEGIRGARSYRLTGAGREWLPRAAADFEAAAAAIRRILQASAGPGPEALLE